MANLDALTADLRINTQGLETAAREMRNFGREVEQIVRRVQQQMGITTPAFDTRPTARARDEINKLGKDTKAFTESFNNDLLKAGRTLASFAAIFYTLKNAFQVFGIGIEFNKTIEESALSLAGLVSSLYDYKDATGKTLQGLEAFEAAQSDVVNIQNEMRVAGLKTSATYEQLMEAMQQVFAPAKDAGVALGQMVPFVQRLTQVAQVAGVPMSMLNEEIRSFATGAMTRRTTRIMPFMESIGLGNEQVKEFIANGTLFTEVMKRTEQIGLMAAKSMSTWTVALSNLKDAFANIMGAGLEGTFGMLKNLFQETAQAIVNINQETGEIKFNPTFLSAIKTIDNTFHSALMSVRAFSIELDKFRQNHPVLMQVGVDVGGIALKLTALAVAAKLLIGIFGMLGRGIASTFTSGYSSLLKFAATFGSLTGLVGIVTSGFSMLVRAMLAIGTAVGAIVQITAALAAMSAVLALFGDYTIPRAAGALWDWIKNWEIFGKTVEEHVRTAILSIEKIGTYLGFDLRSIVSGFSSFWTVEWTKMADEVRRIWSEMPQWLRETIDTITDMLSKMVDSLKKYFSENKIDLEVVLKLSSQMPAGMFPEAEWVNMGVRASKELSERRKQIDKESGEISAEQFWRGYSEASDVPIKQEAQRRRELYKSLGLVEPAWVTKELEPQGISKPKLPEAGAAGAAGKGVESALQRWRSMLDTLDKEIAKAADNSIGQIDTWRTKFLHDMENVVAKAEGGISLSEGVVKLNEATVAKLSDLYENYTKWYAQQTDDRMAALDSEYREAMQKYEKLAETIEKMKAAMAAAPASERKSYQEVIVALEKLLRAQAEVPAVFQTRYSKQQQEYIQQTSDAYRDQLSALKGLVPDMAMQAKIGLELVGVENRIADAKYEQEKIGRQILIQLGLWSEADESRVKAIQEQVKYYKEMQAVMESLKAGAGGMEGYATAWAYERSKEMATRGYEQFKEMMDSFERDIADGLSNAIINALRGKQQNFSEVFFTMAERGIKRAMTGLTATLADRVAGWFGVGKTIQLGSTPMNPMWVAVSPGLGGGLSGGSLLGGGLPIGVGPGAPGGFEGMADWLGDGTMAGGYEDMADWLTSIGGSQNNMMASANNFYNSQAGWFSSLTGSVGGWFGGLWDAVSGFFSNLFSGFSGGGGGLFSGLFGQNYALGFDEFGNFLSVPMFQHGGYVTKPTLAMVGEGGPEWIVPENKLGSLAGVFQGEGRGGGVTINAQTIIQAPEPERYYASRSNLEAQRIQEMRKAMRNI